MTQIPTRGYRRSCTHAATADRFPTVGGQRATTSWITTARNVQPYDPVRWRHTTTTAMGTGLARKTAKDKTLHKCEIHGDHWNTAAVGYVISRTYLGEQVFVWGCAPCKVWWKERHPDAIWVDWESPEKTGRT